MWLCSQRNTFFMKYLYRNLLISVLPAFVSMLVSTHSWAAAERAEDGFIDLTAWLPTSDGDRRLDGQWYLFDNEFIDPVSILKRLDGHQEFVEVPKRWESKSKCLLWYQKTSPLVQRWVFLIQR